MSPRNLLRTRLTIEEKGKAINLETNEDEEDLEDLIIEEDEDKGMEEETEVAHPIINFPAYVPRGRVRQRCPRTSMRARALYRLHSSSTISFLKERTLDECDF